MKEYAMGQKRKKNNGTKRTKDLEGNIYRLKRENTANTKE